MKGLFSQSVSTICFRSKRMVALVGVLMVCITMASAQSSGLTPDDVEMLEPTSTREAYTIRYRHTWRESSGFSYITNQRDFYLAVDTTTTTTTTTTTNAVTALWEFVPSAGQYYVRNVHTGLYLNSSDNSLVLGEEPTTLYVWGGVSSGNLRVGTTGDYYMHATVSNNNNSCTFSLGTASALTFARYTQTTKYTIQINGIGTANRVIWGWDPEYINPQGTMAGEYNISGHKGGPDLKPKDNTLALHEIISNWTSSTDPMIASPIANDREIPLNDLDTLIWTWDNAGTHSLNISWKPDHFSTAPADVTHYDVALTPVDGLPMWHITGANGGYEAWDDYLHIGAKYVLPGTTDTLKIISDQIEYYRNTFHIEEINRRSLRVETLPAPFEYEAYKNNAKITLKLHGTRIIGKQIQDVTNAIVADSTTAVDAADQDIHVENDAYHLRVLNEDGSVSDWCEIVEAETKGNIVTLQTKSNNYTYQERKARLVIEYNYIDEINDNRPEIATLSVALQQNHQFSGKQQFYSQQGLSKRPFDEWGGQAVHEYTTDVYFIPGENYQLEPNEIQFVAWQRWYDWDEETDLGLWTENNRGGYVTEPQIGWKTSNGTTPEKFTILVDPTVEKNEDGTYPLMATQGRYWYDDTGRGNDDGFSGYGDNPMISTSINENSTQFPVVRFNRDTFYHVACDLSNYLDYKISTDSIIEPTLSYRHVWNFIPASKRAAELELHTTSTQTFLEDYVITVPQETAIFLYPEYYHTSTTSNIQERRALLGYIYKSGETYYHIGDATTADALKTTWSVNGVKQENTAPDGRLYQVAGVTNSKKDETGQALDTTIVYTLTAGKYNLCRFTVTFKDKNVVGPVAGLADYTYELINERYELLGELDFDYATPTNSNYQAYGEPLQFDQTTYGFAYPNHFTERHYRKRKGSPFYTSFGEYQLINSTVSSGEWWIRDIDQHGKGASSAQTGYMLYVDGMQNEGLVASLNVDVDLCPGQQLYCSAWMANPSQYSPDPILRFAVEGKMKDAEEWNAVGEFTTGELPKTTAQHWRQIVFEIDVKEDYDQYRVSIYNFARGNQGNDFVVDDITIFASAIPLVAYQATTACDDSDSITAIVRMDYMGVWDDNLSNTPVYYDVYREPKAIGGNETIAGTAIEMDYIVEAPTGLGDLVHGKYGRLHIPGRNFDPENAGEYGVTDAAVQAQLKAHIYDNVALLIKAARANQTDNSWGFVKEGTRADGKTKYSYYVVHYVPLDGQYDYSVRMVKDVKVLLDPDARLDCANATPLPVANAFDLVLDYDVVDDRLNGVCGNDNHTLSMRLTDMEPDATGNIQTRHGRCLSDWILTGDTIGFEITISLPDTTITYDYDDIESAILYDLRLSRPDKNGVEQNTNRFATSLAEITPTAFFGYEESTSVHNYQLVKNLVEAGYLILGQENIDVFVPSQDTIKYLALPIAGTGYEVDENGNAVLNADGEKVDMEICSAPKVIELTSNEQAVGRLEVGSAPRDSLPEVLKNRPAVIRASRLDVVNASVQLPIQVLDKVQLGDAIVMVSTNDPNYDVTKQNFAFSPQRQFTGSWNDYYKSGDMLMLTVSSAHIPAGTTYTPPRPGYSYTFKITLENRDGGLTTEAGCPVGSTYFTINVVPDYLVWSPMNSETSDWNNDANWKAANSLGELTGAPGFVPMSHSNVIIPSTKDAENENGAIKAYYPVVVDGAAFMKEHGNLNTWDVGYQAANCNMIYMKPDSKLQGQEHLNYNKAFVDMQIMSNRWYIHSPALKEVYLGDIFTPNNPATADANPFAPGTFVGNRNWHYAYYHSFHNQKTTLIHRSEDRDTEVYSDEWSDYVNNMEYHFLPGKGYAVAGWGPTNGADEVLTVRLPKSDSIYYYYDADGLRTNRYEKMTRTADNYKFAFDQDTMIITYTNDSVNDWFVFGNPTMAYVDMFAFLEGNDVLTKTFKYLEEDENGIVKWQAMNRYTANAAHDYYLPPMRGVMVQHKDSSNYSETSLTLKLTAGMLTLNQGSAAAPLKKPARTASKTSVLKITAENGVYKSTIHVGESTAADNGFVTGEDSYVMITSPENSPVLATYFNLYAINKDKALDIDIRKHLTTVPLGLSISDPYVKSTTDYWFMGIDQFDNPVYLVDSVAGTSYRLLNGLRLRLENPAAGQQRYYIHYRDNAPDITTGLDDLRPSDSTNNGEENSLLVSYSSGENNEVMVTANAIMRHIAIYDIMGRLIAEAQPNDLRSVITVPSGAYIFRVETGSASRLDKVLVK